MSFYQAKGGYPSRRRPRIARSQARGRGIQNEKRERRLNEDIANKMKHLLNMRMTEMICRSTADATRITTLV
jgi:hypothetical protein